MMKIGLKADGGIGGRECQQHRVEVVLGDRSQLKSIVALLHPSNSKSSKRSIMVGTWTHEHRP
jgi:hypothetical protein